MAIYGVVRTDEIGAGVLRSAKYTVSTVPTAIENGNLVKVGGLLNGANREVFNATAPTAITDTNIGIVVTPELNYDETYKSNTALNQYINVANQNIAVLIPAKETIVSVSDECINALSTTPVVGNYVITKASSTKWDEKASVGGTEGLVGQIIARELYKKGMYLNVIKITKVL